VPRFFDGINGDGIVCGRTEEGDWFCAFAEVFVLCRPTCPVSFPESGWHFGHGTFLATGPHVPDDPAHTAAIFPFGCSPSVCASYRSRHASPSGLSSVAYIIISEIGGSFFASSALYIFAAPLPTLLMRCVRTLVDVGMYLRRCSLSICAMTC